MQEYSPLCISHKHAFPGALKHSSKYAMSVTLILIHISPYIELNVMRAVFKTDTFLLTLTRIYNLDTLPTNNENENTQ